MGWLSDAEPGAGKRHEDTRRRALEERVIKRIWDFAGVRPNLQEALEECRLETGHSDLSFEWFNQKSNFPVQLGASRIPWVHETQVGDLFGPFTKLPFVKEYVKYVEQAGIDDTREQVGLVFPWPHIPKGGSAMVLHNYPVDSSRDDPDVRIERGARIVRPFGNPLVIYVIESLNDFLLTVGTDWTI